MIGYSNASSLNNKYSILVFFFKRLYFVVYIFEIRNEYTYRNLNPPSKPSSPSSCNCEVRGHANPGRQPAYRWLDVPQDKDCSHPQQEGHAVTMSSSNGLTINSIKTPTQIEVHFYHYGFILCINFFLRRSMMTILQSLKTAATDVKIIFYS